MTPTDGRRPDLDEMRAALRTPLREALGGARDRLDIEYLCEPKDVADDPAKLLITSATGQRTAIILVSAPMDPEMVGRGMQIAADAKRALGPRLGSVVLEPLGEGRLHGLSYTILPFRNPIDQGRIARRYWRWRLRSPVLDWLADSNEATLVPVSQPEIEPAFERSLRHLSTFEGMDTLVCEAAREALTQLEAGRWKPHFVLMHGDLWVGNLLRAPQDARAEAPFVLIDWPGAQLRGYPFYDLLRIARSMKLGRVGLEREVARHCQILGAGPIGAIGLMLSGLGHLGLNLGFFPAKTFAKLSLTCLQDLREALVTVQEPTGG